MNINNRQIKIIILILISIFAIILGLMLGEPYLNPLAIIKMIFHKQDSINYTIFWDIRFPRVISAFITGSLLALAGFMMQFLLQNPLADPYILGISGGSSFLTLLLMVLGLPFWCVKAGSWLGAFLSFLFIWFWARKKMSSQSLLLYGVMLGFIWSSAMSLILIIAPDRAVKGMVFWLMGNLADVEFHLYYVFIFLLSIGYSLYFSKSIALLNLGDQKAQSLGLNVKHFQIQLLCLSSFMAASAVSLAGTVGFIGLMVPHLVRKWGFSTSRSFVWAIIFSGGALLTLADTLARTVFLPQELPVGLFTVLMGALSFFCLIK